MIKYKIGIFYKILNYVIHTEVYEMCFEERTLCFDKLGSLLSIVVEIFSDIRTDGSYLRDRQIDRPYRATFIMDKDKEQRSRNFYLTN